MFEVIVGLALLPAALVVAYFLASFAICLILWPFVVVGRWLAQVLNGWLGIALLAGAGVWMVAQPIGWTPFFGYLTLGALVMWFGFKERAL